MNRIEDQANYYKNLHLRDRSIKAVVHVEDRDDVKFWNIQLQNVAPGKYHFVSQSKSNNGTDTKGCEQCLRYLPYINHRFFICIDSDLRLLRKEEGLTSGNFVAQTYAYSWENHHCAAGLLQHRFVDAVPDAEFDFEVFLGELSRAIYVPLQLLVYCKTPELNTIWNIGKFNKCIPLQPSRQDLANNGYDYIRKVRTLFEDAISSLDSPEAFSIAGLTPGNAYLHMQGHQLYKLIMHIGTMLCRGKNVAFKTTVLDSATHTAGYEEINNVQSDLVEILSTRYMFAD